MQATDRLTAGRGGRTWRRCDRQTSSLARGRGGSVRHRRWTRGGRDRRDRTGSFIISACRIGYLAAAKLMDVTERGVTDLVVRIIKGTMTLNDRPRAGGARYDAVRAHRNDLALRPRRCALFTAPTDS